jgi:hypothetical protein
MLKWKVTKHSIIQMLMEDFLEELYIAGEDLSNLLYKLPKIMWQYNRKHVIKIASISVFKKKCWPNAKLMRN